MSAASRMREAGTFLFLIMLMREALTQGQDDRCLLKSGGSTLRYLASEDLEIKGIIGKIDVMGDVGKDIELSLTDGSLLNIEVRNGSGILVLASQLDREGASGSSSIVTSVLCQKLGLQSEDTDPGFVIPIKVSVTDVNDNPPQFLGAPYVVNVSEATPVGSQIISIEAVDADQRGPFSLVEYLIERGQYSDFIELDRNGRVKIVKPLDYENVDEMSIRILARDHGDPPQYAYTDIVINILDADDQNPAFNFDRFEAILPESPKPEMELTILPGPIKAFDQDLGINSSISYSFSGIEDQYRMFRINSTTGTVSINGNITDQDILQPVTLIIQATQLDNKDKYSITTLTVSRNSARSFTHPDKLKFSKEVYTASVVENMQNGSVVLSLATSWSNLDDKSLSYWIEKADMPGDEFMVNDKGEVMVKRTIDFETTEALSFHVYVEEEGQNDSCLVNISVINLNDWDPRFKYPEYEFYVGKSSSAEGHIVGVVDVFDGDKDDEVSLDLSGHSARVFKITKEGEIYINDMSFLTGSEAHFVVTAKDSGKPPRQASVPVLIRFEDVEGLTSGYPRELVGESSNILMVIILCSVSSVFILIIICLGVIICKTKGRLKSLTPTLTNSDTDSIYLQQHSGQYPSQVGSVNLSYKIEPSLTARSSSALTRPSSAVSDKSAVTMASLISTAQAPTSLVSNTSSSMITFGKKQIKHKSNKVTPQDLEADINKCGLPAYSSPVHEKQMNGNTSALWSKDNSKNRAELQEELKNNILQGTNEGAKIPEWPRGSIPRTVKKLSWDDEPIDNDREVPIVMEVGVALTPLDNNKRVPGDVLLLQSLS